MSIRNFIRNVAALARSEAATFTSSNITNAALPASGVLATLQAPGMNTPAESTILAYACITARREAIGGAPLVITDENDREIERGPLADLLRKPNADMNWPQYVRVLETHLSLYNLCAIAPIREGTGAPDALDILHPTGLRADVAAYSPTGTPRVWKWHYVDPTTAEQREFARDALIVHAGYNPHAPMAALSPMNVLKRTFMADICAREQNLALFVNDATPRGYLHSDSSMTKEQAEEVLDVWNSIQKGYANRHKTAALWGGLKYDRLQLTPAELEFLETLKGLRIDYYMAFRVYPAMLAEMTGETGLSQGSSTESQRVAWWEDVGLPELDLIASLHKRIADEFGVSANVGRRELRRAEQWSLARRARADQGAGIKIWFNDSAIPALWRNRISRVDVALKLAMQMGYRPDEVSDYLDLGLPPHPDNLPRIPFSLQVVGQEPEVRSAESGGNAQEANTRTLAALNRLEQLCRADAGDPIPQRFRNIRRAFDAFVAPREKESARKWSRFFNEQRGRVLDRVRAKDILQRADPAGLHRADPPAPRLSADDLLPAGEENLGLRARILPVLRQHMQDGAAFFAEETGQKHEILAVDQDPRFERAIARRMAQAEEVNNSTRAKLAELLQDGYAAGDSTDQLAERISGYYRDNCTGEDTHRPMTAARTETSAAVNDGRLLAAQEVGGLQKGWVIGGSDVHRDNHVAMMERYAASPIALDAKFVLHGPEGTWEVDAPGDSVLPPSEVCNCACMLVFTKLGGSND